MHGRAPYREVLTHGFTVDAKGRKMSKSLGNVVLPQKVIKTLGADILRLWVAATDYRAEMNISDEILTRTADSYRRIRNTARYLLANLDGFEPQHALPGEQLLALDRWALQKTQRLQKEVQEAYESFNFHLIYQKVHQFCVIELGGFYLDVLKDRMYTMPRGSRGRRSAQTAMYHMLEAIVRWLAPILSFTAEEIWSHMPGDRSASVFLQTWHAAWPALPPHDGMTTEYWDEVLAVREVVKQELERLRVAGDIGASLDAEVDLYCEPHLVAALSKLKDELRFVFITSYARVHSFEQAPTGSIATSVKGLHVTVRPSAHAKCVRCWHHREDVGMHREHPLICGRCVSNVGAGEERNFA